MTREEVRIIRRLVSELAAFGFTPCKVHDGEEYVPATDAASAIEGIKRTGMGTLHFQDPSGKWGRFGVLLIEGNGGDIISDYHCGDPTFSGCIDRLIDALDGRAPDDSPGVCPNCGSDTCEGPPT